MYFSQITLVADSVPGKGSFFLVAQSVKNPPAMQVSEFHQEPQELAWSSWGIALINGFMSTGLQSSGWEAGLLPNTQFLPSSAASSPGTRLGTISSRSQFPEP